MTKDVSEMEDRIRKVRYQIRVMHQEQMLIIGLHSLLHLQYLHEGHLDGSVFDVLDVKVHEIESKLSDMLGSLNIDDEPL